MKRFSLAILFLLFFQSSWPIYFRHLLIEDGLSQLSVMSIHQDKLGRMWFGTNEGLDMYDGSRITVFKPSLDRNSLISNKNDDICEDSDGNLYFKSGNKAIKYDVNKQHFSKITDMRVDYICSWERNILINDQDSVFIFYPKRNLLHYFFCLPERNTYMTAILRTANKSIYVATSKGLFQLKDGKTLKSIIPDEDIFSIYEDSHRNLWISSRMDGLYILRSDGRLEHYRVGDKFGGSSIVDNQIRTVAEDNYGNIWFGTFKGLHKYNPQTNTLEVFQRNPLPGSLTHSSIFPIFKDRQGTMWLGTYYGGVNYFNPETDFFTVYTDNPLRNDCLSYNFVGHMVEDKDNNVWICTEGGGVNFFDRKMKRFSYLMSNSQHTGVAHNNVKDICYDEKRNKLYIGTHTGGLSIFDIKSHRFYNPFFTDPEFSKLAGDRIAQIRIHKNYLVFSAQSNIIKMDLDTEKFSLLFPSGKYYGSSCFMIDQFDRIWTSDGGNGLWIVNLNNEADQQHILGGEKGLGNSTIINIFEDSKKRIFLGTEGGGLSFYDGRHHCFGNLNTKNSLILSDYCYEISETMMGNLIINSDKGLTFYNPDTHSFKVVELVNSLPISGINQGNGILVCKNGEIFVGGVDGLVTFFEQQLFEQPKDYKLFFSDLYVNNKKVIPNDKQHILKQALSFTDKISLRYNQNNLTFTFASNNYVNPLKKAAFKYKLEGFDEHWITFNDYAISYTNLNPGKYKLMIQEIQYDPNVIPNRISLDIVIHAPIWETPLFYCLYVIVILTLLYLFYRFKKNQFKLQTSLEYERKEKESTERLTQDKLQFFANISHEFRTPLTLIISQIELLMQNNSFTPSLYNKLQSIYKNAHHMRYLISELLDFRKLEAGRIKLKVKEQNIVAFEKEIYLAFYEFAASHSISYKFNCQKEELLCWFDAQQMEKVFYNLLSNAFKYVKDKGTIEITIEETDTEIVSKVIDTGIGIKKEDIDKIFERFYQAEAAITEFNQTPSTGIGLALTRSIVMLHHGTINVESTPGYGSIFIVRLLKGRAHFTDDECAAKDQKEEISDFDQKKMTATPKNEGEEDSEEQHIELTGRTILIVEDNEELLETLRSLFAPTYRVLLAHDGKEGLNKAREEMPDIILSDVMMPEMSGMEMCIRIKNDFNLCQIPVVLLTALSSVEQSIEGLQRGADDYIGKPFNSRVLLARCNNLLRNRILLQKKYEEHKTTDITSITDSPEDKKMLSRIEEVIDKNIENMAFDMNELATEIGLSRSSLYPKFRKLTGLTPNDYVNERRIKRAAEMLISSPNLQISEIADRLGFNSPRYFSRSFKSLFNVSPAEYRKNAAERTNT